MCENGDSILQLCYAIFFDLEMAPLNLQDDDLDELSMDVEYVPWEECVRTEHEFTGMRGFRRALENIFLKYGKLMGQGPSAMVSFSRDDEHFDVEGKAHLELLPASTLDDADDGEWEKCGDEWILGDVPDGDDRNLRGPDLSEEERKALWTLPDPTSTTQAWFSTSTLCSML